MPFKFTKTFRRRVYFCRSFENVSRLSHPNAAKERTAMSQSITDTNRVSIRWVGWLMTFAVWVFSPGSEARGPHLPTIAPAPVGTHRLICLSLDLEEIRPEVAVTLGATHRAPVMVVRQSTAELGYMQYSCRLIDDGPYGALQCTFSNYEWSSIRPCVQCQKLLGASFQCQKGPKGSHPQ